MRLENKSRMLVGALGLALVAGLGVRAQQKPPVKQTPAPAPPAKTAPVQKAPVKQAAPMKQAAPAPAPVTKQAPPKVAPAPAPATQAPAKPMAQKAPRRPPVTQTVVLDPVALQRGRRDPFKHLVAGPRSRAAGGTDTPVITVPGKGGLVVATTRLDGLVKAPSGMIAVVSSPQNRVYFLREGDRLYDGRVEKITMDGMTLREMSKDAFGKPLERVVMKRIYGSAGEQP